MVRQASNSSVSSIEVEVDRAADRSRKKDNVRSNTGSPTISGSGASGTLKSNTSSGDWYLETVSGYALSLTSGGTVGITVEVADSDGNTKSQLAADVHNGYKLDFGGVNVKPGWDIKYSIEQDDSNSYTIEISPLIRKPNPSAPTTVEVADTIDSFEDGSLSEYSGATGSYSVTSSKSYHQDKCLKTTTQASKIYSTSGLENYPERGDTFSYYFQATSTTVSDDPRCSLGFALQDKDNYREARVNIDEREILVREVVSGSDSTITRSPDVSGFDSDKWYKCVINWSDPLVFEIIDPADDSQMTSVSVSESSFSGTETNGGVSWYGSIENSNTLWLDNASIE